MQEYQVVLGSNKIIVNDWEVVKHRATPVLEKMYIEEVIGDERIYADFVEIVTREKKGRESQDDRIFFLPFGLTHEDIAFASLTLRRAKAKGPGQSLRLWDKPI